MLDRMIADAVKLGVTRIEFRVSGLRDVAALMRDILKYGNGAVRVDVQDGGKSVETVGQVTEGSVADVTVNLEVYNGELKSVNGPLMRELETIVRPLEDARKLRRQYCGTRFYAFAAKHGVSVEYARAACM